MLLARCYSPASMTESLEPSGIPRSAFPADPWHLLRNSRAMSDAIAAVISAPPDDVRKRLWREFLLRGSSVRRAAKEAGVTWYEFDEAMVRLYESDAFLFELAIWNVNLLKRAIRSWVTKWITKKLGPNQAVLCWGDGMGFDSLSLAQAGHEVTWFDLPGHSSRFAQSMFEAAGASARTLTDPAGPAEGGYDAIVCLDVLEHVPEVEAELRRIRRCLKSGGVFIVHAPFYFLHRNFVTHLRVNRRFSGSLALFRRAGFKLLDAHPSWAPLVFVRDDGTPPRRPLLALPRLALAYPFGLVLSIGRVTALPFEAVNLVCRLVQPWFIHDMLGRGARKSLAARDSAPE